RVQSKAPKSAISGPNEVEPTLTKYGNRRAKRGAAEVESTRLRKHVVPSRQANPLRYDEPELSPVSRLDRLVIKPYAPAGDPVVDVSESNKPLDVGHRRSALVQRQGLLDV